MTSIEVRPERGNWNGIVVFAFFTLLGLACVLGFLLDGSPSSRNVWGLVAICGLSSAASGAGAIIGALWMQRWRIIGDESGLRWRRTFGDWQSARWEEVSDFYSLSPRIEKSRYVEIGEQQLALEGTNVDALAELVAERAVNAPYRSWQMRGTRPGESFERRFAAWSPFRWIWGIVGAILVLLCIRAMLQPTESRDEWLWKVGPFALLLLPIALLMLGTVAGRFIQRFEWLEMSERGLTLGARSGERFVEWKDLKAVRKDWRCYVISTAQGEFRMGSWLPMTLIRSRAFVLAPQTWFEIQVEGCARTVTEEGICFSRSRAVQFLATFCTVLFLFSCVSLWLVALVSPEPERASQLRSSSLPFLLLCLLPLCLWVIHWRSAVMLRADGLELRGVWRTQFFPWNELDVRHDERGEYLSAEERRISPLGNWFLVQEIESEIRKHLAEH